MRINGRDWPPDPLQPTPKPKSPPESWLVLLLILGSPVAAWLIDWFGVTWARVIWPAGWLTAIVVLVTSGAIRTRRPK